MSEGYPCVWVPALGSRAGRQLKVTTSGRSEINAALLSIATHRKGQTVQARPATSMLLPPPPLRHIHNTPPPPTHSHTSIISPLPPPRHIHNTPPTTLTHLDTSIISPPPPRHIHNTPPTTLTHLDTSTIGKIFEGEMLIRTLPTTLLQIFCKRIPNSEDINKSVIVPDDNFRMKP